MKVYLQVVVLLLVVAVMVAAEEEKPPPKKGKDGKDKKDDGPCKIKKKKVEEKKCPGKDCDDPCEVEKGAKQKVCYGKLM